MFKKILVTAIAATAITVPQATAAEAESCTMNPAISIGVSNTPGAPTSRDELLTVAGRRPER